MNNTLKSAVHIIHNITTPLISKKSFERPQQKHLFMIESNAQINLRRKVSKKSTFYKLRYLRLAYSRDVEFR